ncbi:MAG: site-2 protease family protein [Geodermatophilaceae bacterium]|nr:site-2 protease family protein [Geodermatophilaceae bacterium]
MSGILWTVLGIGLFVVGLLFSIWFHELGHFMWARRFGMRVPQFMVGFGPTLWSRQRGETEHGIKAIPLGGYIRIVGMIPPARQLDGAADGQQRTYGRLRRMIEEVRGAALDDIQPGDEDRVFYRKPWWQRVIVMSAGPVHNLILASLFFTVILVGFGIPQGTSLTINTVSECVLPAGSPVQDCTTPIDGDGLACAAGDNGCDLPPASPAAQAGLRAGDRITAVDGEAVSQWEQVQDLIRVSAGDTRRFTVDRDGQSEELSVTPLPNLVYLDAEDAEAGKPTEVGFVGVSPVVPRVQQSITEVPAAIGGYITRAGEALINLPERIPSVFGAAFLGDERGQNDPIGVVGVSRLSGEYFALPEPFVEKIIFFLLLLASVNMVLFLFNLVPIYPLDGGHVAGALYEKARSVWARIRNKPDPGPFDIARLMPIAYVVAAFFVLLSGMLLIADIVNPITLN